MGDVRDMGSISGSERFPGEGHCNPFQYSFLESPVDREAWWATVHRVTQSQTQLKQLSMHVHICKGESQSNTINSPGNGAVGTCHRRSGKKGLLKKRDWEDMRVVSLNVTWTVFHRHPSIVPLQHTRTVETKKSSRVVHSRCWMSWKGIRPVNREPKCHVNHYGREAILCLIYSGAQRRSFTQTRLVKADGSKMVEAFLEKRLLKLSLKESRRVTKGEKRKKRLQEQYNCMGKGGSRC